MKTWKVIVALIIWDIARIFIISLYTAYLVK